MQKYEKCKNLKGKRGGGWDTEERESFVMLVNNNFGDWNTELSYYPD